MDLSERLSNLRDRGIEIFPEQDLLRYRAPKGVMTPPDRAFLAEAKEQILELLDPARAPVSPPVWLAPTAGALGTLSPATRVRGPSPLAPRPSQAASGVASRPAIVGAGDGPRNPDNSGNCPNPPSPGDFANCSNIPGGSGRAEAASSPVGIAGVMEVHLGGRAYRYSAWAGVRLRGDRVGFDTETALIEGHEVPELALATASDGVDHFVIHPDRLAEFIRLHRDKHFVAHNSAFDHRVVVKHLESRGEAGALEDWWGVVDANRLHDTMLLDQLVRLGRDDTSPRDRDLGAVAAEHAGLELDKADPYRLRYAEFIGQDWGCVDRGFFDYAIKDPIATLAAYEALAIEAEAIMAAQGLDPAAIAGRHGPLGENYQVKGSIALAAMTRLGMAVDPDRVAEARRAVLVQIRAYAAELSAIPGTEELFHKDRGGCVVERPSTPAPSIRQDQLRRLLCEHADRVAAETGLQVPTAKTKGGLISIAAGAWEPLAPFDPLIRAWLEMEGAAKSYQFLAGLDAAVVHPEYGLARTGRATCWAPNIQQMPRKGGFRESFVARPGFVLVILDYRFSELRTLAAVCEARFGESRLAEVIRAGVDPHVYTAAMLAGMEPDDFKLLASANDPADRERYGELRQKAKAINFGIPGGLGAAALVAYALAQYGVVMSLAEAEAFRNRLVEDVYPELGLYLADDGMETLARNLKASPAECWARLDWKGDRSGAVAGGVRNVVGGKTRKADGTPYKQRYLRGTWAALIGLNRDPELAPLLAARLGGEALRDRLFRGDVATLTGRVRGRVGFTQARNTPFQGLAADGAKLALYRLVRAGYRVVAFVHDEVVIELPQDADHAAEALRVESIMNRAMESLTGGVPVECEYALARCWSKEAKAVFDAEGRLIPFEFPNPQAGRSA